MTQTKQVPDKPGWQVAGLVHAPADRVWQALLDVNTALTTEDKRVLTEHDPNQVFVVSHGEHNAGRITIEVDKRQRTLAMQGEWWYRGVYKVEAQGERSRVTYSVYNVAPGLTRWAAQLVQGPQNAREMPNQLMELLRGIGKKLGCEVELVA